MRLNADGTDVGRGGRRAGEAMTPTPTRLIPALTIVDNRPWVTYSRSRSCSAPPFPIRVARLSDTAVGRTQVGGPSRMAPARPDRRPAIATIDGTPTVAVAATIAESSKRVHVFRPTAGGTGWQRVGNGPGLAEWRRQLRREPRRDGQHAVGLVVRAVQRRQRRARRAGCTARRRRLAAGRRRLPRPGEQPRGGRRDAARVGQRLPVGRLHPGRRHHPREPGPGCCNQARVARLEPGFGRTEAFPGFDSATLLAETTTYGLPYPLRFEYGPDGATGASTPAHLAQGDSTFALGEARGLNPATLYGFRPLSTAGTPAPLVRGPQGHFATTPMPTSTTSSPQSPAPAPGRRRRRRSRG